jgi:hypothetical protein
LKKISFNFSDFQYEEFQALSKRDNKAFSEVVRNALDDWLLSKKRGVNISVQTTERPGVTIILSDPRRGDDGVLYYDDATANEVDEEVTVWRNDEIVARFNSRYVDCWYIE